MISPILAAPALSTFLIGLLVKGVLLMGAAWLGMLALKRTAAATRHAIWALAFGGLLLLPLGAVLLPHISVPLWPSDIHQTELVLPDDASLLGPPPVAAPAPAAHATPDASAHPDVADAASASSRAAVAEAASPSTPLPPAADNPTPEAPGLTDRMATALSSVAAWPTGRWMLVVWAAGVLAMLGHLGVGLLRTAWLVRNAHPVDGPRWAALLNELKTESDVHTPVRLLQHDRVRVPMIVSGPTASTILLPSLYHTWSAEQQRLVLLHELAHVKRRDVPVHLLAECARALHWPNPLVHLAARQLLLEREKACDAAVLATGVDAPSYAETLVDTARTVLRRRREVWTGALAMAQPSELKDRVISILSSPRPARASVPRLHMAGMSTLALLLVFTLAAVVPGPANESGPVDFTHAPDGSSPAHSTGPEAPPMPSLSKTFGVAVEDRNQPVLRSGAIVLAAPGAAPSVEWEYDAEIEWETDVAAEGSTEVDVKVQVEEAAQVEETAEVEVAVAKEANAQVLALSTVRADTTDGALSNVEIEVQEKAVHALSQLPREQSVPRLIDIARTHPSNEIREKAVFWLGQTGGQEVVNFFDTLIDETDDPDLQEKLVFAIAQLPREESVPRLQNIAETHDNPDVREKAIFWLGQTGGSEVIAFFGRYLERTDLDPDLQEKVVFALSQLPEEEAVPRLVDVAQNHPNPEIRKKAIFYLGQTDDPRAIDALMSIVQGDN